ncbi:hypothetical protein Tco_0694334 [Tanacetum coccineum]
MRVYCSNTQRDPVGINRVYLYECERQEFQEGLFLRLENRPGKPGQEKQMENKMEPDWSKELRRRVQHWVERNKPNLPLSGTCDGRDFMNKIVHRGLHVGLLERCLHSFGAGCCASAVIFTLGKSVSSMSYRARDPKVSETRLCTIHQLPNDRGIGSVQSLCFNERMLVPGCAPVVRARLDLAPAEMQRSVRLGCFGCGLAPSSVRSTSSVKPAYLLTRIEFVLINVQGSRVYSKLDLRLVIKSLKSSPEETFKDSI